MKTVVLNAGFILLLSAVVGCNPAGYVKVDVFQDLFKNSPPTLSSFNCSSTSLTEGDTLSCSAAGNDTGDFTYRLSLQNTCGNAVIDADTGVINLPTNNSFVPGCTLSVEAYDGEFASAPINVAISVANTVPTLSIADVTLPEDSVLIASDAAVQSSEGDNGVYALDTAATTGTKCSSVGTLSIDAVTGAVSLNAANWVGSCNITVTYDDGNGGVASEQFTYTATGVNDGPIISGTCGTTVNQDVAYSCSALSAVDPEGDSITWELAPANNCAFIAINSSTGALSGTPNDDQVGTCTLAVRTTDGTAYSTVVYSQNLTVVNVAPTLTISNKSSGDTIGPFVVATDAEVQSNEEGYGVYSLDNATTSGTKCSDHGSVSIHATNGEVTFDGTDGWVGTCNIKVVFNDQNPTSNLVSSQFALTITDTVGPTVISVDSLLADGTYTLGSTVSIRVTFNEPVNVTGTPKIVLETGFIDREASYVTGSGSRYLTFNYTVEADDFSGDLDVSSAAVIALNGGTLQDISANAATLTLPVGADPNSLQSLKNIVVAGTFPFAELSNVPDPIARTSLTDMTVGGSGVTHYKFKWGIKGSVDCSVATDYSAETAIAQKITESLTSVVVGNSVVFCVVGKNASGVWQPYSAATAVEWIKGEYSMGPISLAGLSNLPNWKDVTIDSFGRIIARNARGEIFRSVDNGANWQLQCKMTPDGNAHFKTDPSAAGHTYLVSGGNLYKVESYNGAPCPQKTASITDFNYTYFYSPIDIDSDGTIYLFVADATAQRDYFYKSTDQGDNWNLVTTLTNHGWSSSFAIDPADKNKMVRFSADDADTTKYGLYTTSDAGVSWTKTASRKMTFIDIKYNPAQASSFYTHTGDYSVDGGASLLGGNASNIVTDMRRFHIDTNGAGYFVQENSLNTVIRRTNNYGVTAHSVLYNFPNVSSDKNSQAISAKGNLIAAVLGGRMYISTNAGANFNLINWQGTKLALFTGITTKDGKTVYGVTADWNIVKSGDVGETWELKYTYGRGCTGKDPRIDTHELEKDRFSVWANGSYCPQYVSSVDGGNTISYGKLALNSDTQTHIYNPLDSNFEGFRYQGGYRQTTDGGFEWETFYNLQAIIVPGLDAYHDSVNGNVQWQVDLNSLGSLYKTSTSTHTNTFVNSGHTTVSGLDAFVNHSGNFEIRVIDRAGKVRRSVDQGVTFTDLGTSPALASCNKRYFYSMPQNRDVMAMICANGDDLTFTVNGGQTWRTIDFDGLYGINCDASGIALHPNKFFVACRTNDVLYVKYNAIELTNDVSDSVLSAADVALGRPVVQNTIANEFASTEYAVIPLNGTCDGSLTFSSSVPLSNDAGFSSSGDYQVCVKLTDFSSVVSYDRSPIIRFDSTVPAGGSLALTGVLADSVLKRHEFMDDISPVVNNITGSGHDKVAFAVIPNADTCNNSQRYSYSIPTGNFSNQFVSINSGSWKICLRLSDQAGNGDSFSSSVPFTYDNTAVYSVLSGLPQDISNKLSLNVTVGGTGITSYRYKVGVSYTTNCAIADGYSSERAIATPITDDLTIHKPLNLENSTSLRVCVVGNDASGNWQPMKEATYYDWSLYRYSSERIQIAAPEEIENWKAGWIDIHNNSIFYATDYSGMVYTSSNGGDNWTKLCRAGVSVNNVFNMEYAYRQSSSSDKTLYLLTQGEVFKVESKNGGECINLTADLQYITTNYYNVNFNIGPAGTLYVQLVDGSESRDSIYKSSNGGLSWTRTGGGIVYLETYNPTFSMRPDPVVPKRLFASWLNTTRPDLYGIYRSDDDGATWTQVATASGPTWISSYYQTSGKWMAYNEYNPMNGLCTNNSWSTNFSCSKLGLDNFGAQNLGKFHSFTDNMYSTQSTNGKYAVSRSGSGDNDGYSTVFQIPSTPINSNYPNFVVQGNSILSSGGGRMYISTNAGSTFKKIKSANPFAYPLTLEAVKNEGKSLLTVTQTGTSGLKKNFITNDAGQNWTAFSDPQETCFQNLLQATGDMDYLRYSAMVLSSCAENNFNSFSRDYVTNSTFGGAEVKVTDITNPANGYMFGTAYMGRTTSYWQYYDYKNVVMPYIYPTQIYRLFREGFVDPRDSNRFFMLTVNDYGDPNYPVKLALVDYETSSLTDLTANSNFPVISGTALAHDKMGGHYLYNISSEGKIERSSNYGSSFTVINSTELVNTSYCNGNRIYYVNPDDYRYQQTACNGDALSIDGGLSFIKYAPTFTTDRTYDGCGTYPKFFDGKNLYVKCSLGLMKLKFNDFELAGQVADRVLDSSEQGSDPLVTISEPGYFSLLEYAVVASGVTCDGSLTYSSTIPTSNNPAFTTSGKYKVCVRYNDGSLKYAETTHISYTSGAPVFTSIALVNQAADGVLSQNEKRDGYSPIVSNLVASNYSAAAYQVANAGDVCSSLTGYINNPPLANLDGHEVTLVHNNSYKVCVRLSNGSGVAYGSSGNFLYEENFPEARLAVAPGLVEKNIDFTSAVVGTGVTHYRYKFGRADFIQCSSDTSYGAETPVATSITMPLSSLTIEKKYKLCLVGKNNLNEWQPYRLAKEYVFFVAPYRITPFSPGSFDIGNWIDVAISDTDPNYMAILAYNGDIFRTKDAGVTWKLMCKAAQPASFTNESRYKLLIANDATKTIYLSGAYYTGGTLKVDERDGKACVKITNHHSAVDSMGRLYSLSQDTSSQYPGGVYRSADSGATWTRLMELSSTYNDGVVHVNRYSDDNILVISNASTGQIFESTDAGLNWVSRPSMSLFLLTQPLISSPVLNNTFFQQAKNAATNNGGATVQWLYGPLAFKGDGTPYRLSFVSSTQTLLETNTDVFNSGTWTPVHSFNLWGSGSFDVVVASGNTIAVIISKKLYLSTNGGTTFNPVSLPMTNFAFNSFRRSATRIYGLTNHNAVFESVDNGASWTLRKQYLDGENNLARNLSVPSVSDGQVVVGTMAGFYITRDNFVTTSTLSRSTYGYCFYENVVDSLNYILGLNDGHYTTTNGFGSFTNATESITNTCYTDNRLYLNPLSPNQLLHTLWGTFYLYNSTTNVSTPINHGLSNSFSGAEFYFEAGTYVLRVVDIAGNMRESTDFSATFSSIPGTANPYGNNYIYNSKMTSDPNDRDYILNNGGSSVAYTFDGGATWGPSIKSSVFDSVLNCGTFNDVIPLNDGARKALLSCGADTSAFQPYLIEF